MLQIAVCDDNPQELAVLAALLNEYSLHQGLPFDVWQFSHPDALLSALEKQHFSLYILDIVMPMLDGIAVGKMIRKMDKSAHIIYVTTEAGFALQSFAANPINFLTKPIDKVALFETLSLVLSKVEMDSTTYTIKTKEGIFTVHQSKILCCEFLGRGVVYTLWDGSQLRGRSSTERFSHQIAPLLTDGHFLQPHSSFAVNLRYVQELTRDALLLPGHISIPISRKQYAFVRDRYLDYRLAREVRSHG